MLVKCSSVD